MQKLKIDYRLLFPASVASDDACIERLITTVESKPGVESAHLVQSASDQSHVVCIHYDPSVVSTAELRDAALTAGATLDAKYGHVFKTIPATHMRRASAIETHLSRIEGVLEAVVSPDGKIRVEFDRQLTNEATITESLQAWTNDALEPVTPAVRKSSSHVHSHGTTHAESSHVHGSIFGSQTELIFAGLCGVFLLIGWLLESFSELGVWVPLAVFLFAYFFGGYFTVNEAIEKIRSGKFEVDFLMIAAAGGAATLGAWAEGALLLFLFSIGHSLEGYAMGRAKRAIEALGQLAPRTARVRRGGIESDISVEEVVVGDVVVIKPDERVPADGFVIAGSSSVNQAPITGESVPSDKYRS